MAAATFTLELKKPPRKDGTFAVRIRITKLRKHAYYNVGKYILKNQWNETPSPKLHNYVINHEHAKQYNTAIKAALSGLDQISDKNPSAAAAGIKEAYELALNPEPEEKQNTGPGYLAFADAYVLRATDNNYGTGKGYGLYIKEFKAVSGNIPASELLSVANIHKYLQALKKKGNAPKSIRNKIRILSAIYNAWPANGKKGKPENPFAIKITVPKKKKPRPTAAQVKAFIAYQPKTEEERTAKLVTMLQYFLQGARISEAITLEWANVHPDYIEYLPRKEARLPKFIPRSETMNWLLDQMPRTSRYVLPLLEDKDAALPPKKFQHKINRFTTAVNDALKKIAVKLDIEVKLSSHMFRHAFADVLIASGVNPHTAAALLGHANAKTSEDYFKDLGLGDISALALSILNTHDIPGEHSGEQ